MEDKITEYIKNLGLECYEWHEPDCDVDADLVLMVISDNGVLSLSIGKQCGYDFLAADDISWSGPVRNVVSWCKVKQAFN